MEWVLLKNKNTDNNLKFKISFNRLILLNCLYFVFLSFPFIKNSKLENKTYQNNEIRFLQDQGLINNVQNNDQGLINLNPIEDILNQKNEKDLYSLIFNNSNIINNISLTTYTKVDFISEATSKNFTFDLEKNLRSFLGEYSNIDLNLLSDNKDYLNFINKNFQKRTILIGIDGMVQSCINFDKLSAFKFLTENGSYNFNTRSTTEGFSGPGWSSVLCSLTSKDTGIVNNYWKAPWINKENKSNYKFATPINGLDKSFPCIFDELKSKKKFYTSKIFNSNFTNVIYSSWEYFRENFSNNAYPNSIDIYSECLIRTNQTYFEYINCDSYSLEKSKNIVLQDFDLYFWYFASLDVAGHTFSFCSSEYQSRVVNVNNILMEFFKYLDHLKILDKINIIITSDHGTDRNRLAHGIDKYDGNLFVPLFMMGPDFKKNYLITEHTSIIDIPPTIMRLNNLPISDLWSGKVISEVLTTTNETPQKNVEVFNSSVIVLSGDFLNPSYLQKTFLFMHILIFVQYILY